jgi:hypothetical protein
VHIANTAQKERILKLVQQIISKVCTLADGASMFLDANGFKTTKDIIDTFSNITRFIFPKSDSIMAHFYDVEKKGDVEEKKIVFKRLISTTSSTCKVILKFAPQLTRLQTLSKIFPYVSLILDILELGLNYKNFTKDGLTIKNVSKIAAAVSYHIISCATFVIAGSSGVIGASILVGTLFVFFNRLAGEGMKDVALIVQPFDKLFLSNKITDNVSSFIGSICSDRDISDRDISHQRSMYLSLIGLNLCYSAASAIVKLIRDSRETPETNITEPMSQEKESLEDINGNLSMPQRSESTATMDIQMAR